MRINYGVGLIVYVRSDICFIVVEDPPNLPLVKRAGFKIESIRLRLARHGRLLLVFIVHQLLLKYLNQRGHSSLNLY